MRILVPVDGSDCSERALRFAAEMSRRYEGSMKVVHITDVETEATDIIVERSREILEEEGVDDEPSVSIDMDLSFRSSNRVGKDVLEMAEEGDYDHVVMGHHGSGAVERLILGSAAETVVQAGEVPATIVP